MTPSPNDSIQQVVVSTATVLDTETPEQKYARLYSGPVDQPPQRVQPQAPVPQTPQTYQIPAELTSTLEAMRNELAEMRARTTPVPITPPVVSKSVWVDKIREGDFEGAENSLRDSIKASLISSITEEAYQKASAATTIQIEMDRHLNKVRTENPDIARFERYLQAPVNTRIEAARTAGKIRTSEDFVREYKLAVDTEVQELRNLGLQYRADGKNEALTRTTNVRVDAFTPPPQQVGDHASPQAPLSQQGESVDDYFARRNAQGQRGHGL